MGNIQHPNCTSDSHGFHSSSVLSTKDKYVLAHFLNNYWKWRPYQNYWLTKSTAPHKLDSMSFSTSKLSKWLTLVRVLMTFYVSLKDTVGAFVSSKSGAPIRLTVWMRDHTLPVLLCWWSYSTLFHILKIERIQLDLVSRITALRFKVCLFILFVWLEKFSKKKVCFLFQC